MRVDPKIEELVARTVQATLTSAQIESVSVDEDVDYDGDPAFNITVVFESPDDRIDPRELVQLTRQVRTKLLSKSHSQFPFFRFLSKKEHERLKRAAA